MNYVYVILYCWLGIGILFTLAAFLISFNNRKQRKIEEDLLEKEFMDKYHRKPDRVELPD